ncbi:MAG: ABC-type phosphate transport system, substrate binding protein [Cyanobacteriota bacterium]
MPVAKKALALCALGALSSAAIAPVVAQTTLNGAGATFPAPIYQKWFSDLAGKKGPQVNYQAVGSGAGIRQFQAGTVDFGATDDPIDPAEAAKVSKGVLQIPMVGGSIAVAYNKAGCDLKLTQKQVAGIFLGNIKDWKELQCAPGPISVAHRSDGSGTTYAFTNALSDWSPEFKKELGTGKTVQWPVGVGGKGNDGVASVLQNTAGSIGYVNQSFVKGALKAAAIQNKSGQFLKPTAASGAAGLAGIRLDSNLAGEATNPHMPGAYPLVTLTWVLAYKSGNGDKADDLQKAFNFMLSKPSQAQADDLGYVPLPAGIQAKSLAAVKQVGK